MNAIAWMMLFAALLPLFAAAASKAGGKGFDNHHPRSWLASQQGWRARGDAAQKNIFEGLPFFYAAVLFAVYNQADTGRLATLMAVWLALRVLFILAYLADRSTIRSLIWGLALVINAMVLFAGV